MTTSCLEQAGYTWRSPSHLPLEGTAPRTGLPQGLRTTKVTRRQQ